MKVNVTVQKIVSNFWRLFLALVFLASFLSPSSVLANNVCYSSKKGVDFGGLPTDPAKIATLGVKIAGSYKGIQVFEGDNLRNYQIDEIPQLIAIWWLEDTEPTEWKRASWQKEKIKQVVTSPSYNYKPGMYWRIGNEPLKVFDTVANLKNLLPNKICPQNPDDYWQCRKDILKIYKNEMMAYVLSLDPLAKFIFGNLEVPQGCPDINHPELYDNFDNSHPYSGCWIMNTERLWYKEFGHSLYQDIEVWGVHHYFQSRKENSQWPIESNEYENRFNNIWKTNLIGYKNSLRNSQRCQNQYNQAFAAKCQNQKVWVTEFGDLNILVEGRDQQPPNVAPPIGPNDPILRFMRDSTRFLEEQDWIGGYLWHHFGWCLGQNNGGSSSLFEKKEGGNCELNILGLEYQTIPKDESRNCLGQSQVTPTLTPSQIPGDINSDSHVNMADYAIMVEKYGTNDPSCDFNHNGLVDMGDYAILVANYGN